jgi:hypothetical protein
MVVPSLETTAAAGVARRWFTGTVTLATETTTSPGAVMVTWNV